MPYVKCHTHTHTDTLPVRACTKTKGMCIPVNTDAQDKDGVLAHFHTKTYCIFYSHLICPQCKQTNTRTHTGLVNTNRIGHLVAVAMRRGVNVSRL